MSYMIEISQEKQGQLMQHAEQAYQHLGKMLECIEQMGQQSEMGQRDDDEYYVRRFNRDRMNPPYMGERMGRREGGYGYRNGGGYGRRDESTQPDPLYY